MEYSKKEKRGGICFYNIDNIEFMKTKPDNYYDLAIVDPPYGINEKKSITGYSDGCRMNKLMRENESDWDIKPPPEYWEQLFRVSKNQIVWGGNYFTDILPVSREWVIWNKDKYSFKHSDFEMAYTSFDGVAKIVKIQHHGFLIKDKIVIHPTQKPVMLYEWIIMTYIKKYSVKNILDTHGGSGSIAIGCDKHNVILDICEVSEKYFKGSLRRFDDYKRQGVLF